MRFRLPSPAMIVALVALLAGLTGTAIAQNVVPLAARAKVADNAKKLQGRTSGPGRTNSRSGDAPQRQDG